MSTKVSTKRLNSRTSSIDPFHFSQPKNSRQTPTSLTGWAEEEKSSLLLPYPQNESRLILKREKQPPNKRTIKTSSSSTNLQQAYTTTKTSTRPDQSPKHTQTGGWLTKRAKQYIEVLNKIEPKVPITTGNNQQPLITLQTGNRPLSSYLWKVNKKQEEFPAEIKIKENFKEKSKEKSISFIRLKSHMLELNHPSFPQNSTSNDQSPISVGRDDSKSPSRMPTPFNEIFRIKEDNVIASPYPFTPKIKKRVPTGCFKALNSTRTNFTRKTYMGISRLTKDNNGSISQRNSQYENGISNLFNNESMVFPSAPNEDKSNTSLTKTAYIHKLLIAQKDYVTEDKPISNTNLLSRRASFLNDKGYQSERKSSTISMPCYVDNPLSYRESPRNSQQNLMEKLKPQTKTKKYRPKTFLKSFKPKIKGNVLPNELCIRAVHYDNPNTSLIY